MPATSTTQQTDTALEVLLFEIVAASNDLERAEANKRRLLDQLSTWRDLGRVDDKLTTASGYALQWSPGRQSYDYPADVVALEAQLQAAREAAVATRRATPKPARPFWIVRKPKAAKDQEVEA